MSGVALERFARWDETSRNAVGLGSVVMICAVAGTRLYAVDPALSPPELHTYDLTVDANGGAHPELGTPAPLAGDPGANVMGFVPALVITPDGATVFIAGIDGIAVQPVP